MFSRTLGWLVVLFGVGGVAAWAFSPGLRTRMVTFWHSQAGWTEAARRADPGGFATHAEAKLKADLATMDQTRRELAAEVGRLSKTAREQSVSSRGRDKLSGESMLRPTSAHGDPFLS